MTTSFRRHCGTAAVAAIAIAILTALASPAGATWSLVWADEFNGTGLDYANWAPDIGNGCPDLCGWGNSELQYYRAQNVAVTGGNLVLTTRAESIGGNAFTSGKVTTRDKRSFLYGRVEMRAKLPSGGGMWPAFWLMPQSDVYGGWAASGEIDIMESANGTTSVGGALHYGGSYPANTSTSSSFSLGGANFADDFHIYAVEWEEDQIRWYVDGTLFMTRTSAQWYSSNAPGNPRAPFDQPFYIILNTAVGGWYTGCTSTGCVTASLPQQYLVDYVHVYEDIPNDLPIVTINSPAPAATLPAGDITITATATDSDGTVTTVEFYNGATLLGSTTTEPYAYTWTAVPDGCYAVTVRAIDDLGGTTNATVDLTVGAGCGQAAWSGFTPVMPGRLQAEDYDIGGAGVAYLDTEAANNGGQYRPAEGVDIESCSDTGGGHNIGWVNPGEWIEYTVDVPAAGGYTLRARVASLAGGGSFRLEFGGIDRTGSIAVPSTTGWQTWTTVSAPAFLPAGPQVMRFVPTGSGFNVNWFEVVGGASAARTDLQPALPLLHPCHPNPFNPSTLISYELPEAGTARLAIHDTAGRLVRTLVAGQAMGEGRHEVTWDGRDDAGRNLPAGVYHYRLEAAGHVVSRSLTLLK
ncbi:MAG: family 16 glycosylhydrolase [bacterium]|nr:family 16 glycosylhydrolase [bacterium]